MMKKLMSILNKALRMFAKAFIALVILSLIVGVYGAFKARWAKKRVEAFDRQVVIGMPVAEVETRAREMRLKHRQVPDGTAPNGRLLVWEGFAFARWFCDVEYRDGRASDKKVTFLD